MRLSISEAAEYVGVSQGSLRRWSDQGLIRHVRTPGGQRRYSTEALDAFISSWEIEPKDAEGAKQ